MEELKEDDFPLKSGEEVDEDSDDGGEQYEKERVLKSFTFAKYVDNGVFNPLLMMRTIHVIEETPTRQVVRSVNVKTKKLYKVLRFNKATLSGEEVASGRNNYKMLTTLRHPNIVWTFHFYENAPNFYLVQEYFTRGSLISFFASNPPMDERTTRLRVRELLGATKYLQMMGMDFRDFSLRSLMVNSRGTITIDDVDLTYGPESLVPFENYHLCFIQGTVLTDDIHADMTVYGEIMYLILTGQQFSAVEDIELLFSRSDVSDDCKHLVVNMLTNRSFRTHHLLQSDWMNCRT